MHTNEANSVTVVLLLSPDAVATLVKLGAAWGFGPTETTPRVQCASVLAHIIDCLGQPGEADVWATIYDDLQSL